MRMTIRRSDFYLIPNILTLSRVLAVPVVALCIFWSYDTWAAVFFALAGLSDYVDGWIARRYGYESKLGILLDPLADKLIVVSTMIMLLAEDRLAVSSSWFNSSESTLQNLIPPALVIGTVGREIAITGLRAIASSIGIVIPADQGGKIKTWIQFFAIFFLLYNQAPFRDVGFVLLVLSVIVALWSGIAYIFRFIKKLPD